MRRIVVGTAGHIDHGKTSLLQALTGIDCDRWAEEKERGITIDLGFAHLQEADLLVGFVDVPGHEKFLNNALAGLGGIRMVLLVVAADEGVKPQTREHLAICSLLEIPHAMVVLTKSDLVDDDIRELAQLEVEELLEPTLFAGSPVLSVSSVTGDGIPGLRQALLTRAAEIAVPADSSLPFRLPVDRAFQLRGLGAIVTGTLISGRVETGQTLEVLPRGAEARVRSIQVHGEERGFAEAGERTAIQLTGVDLADLQRGEQLVTPELFRAAPSLCVQLSLLPEVPEPLDSWTQIRFHIYAAEVTGKMRPLGGPLEPGTTGMVEIRLDRPVVSTRGDRFIIRRPSPAATLGGGVILDPLWRRRRGKQLKVAVAALSQLEDCLELWTAETGERGATAAELAPRLGLRANAVTKHLDVLVKANRLLRVPAGQAARYITPDVCKAVLDRGRQMLEAYFRDNRLATGMPKAEFLGRLLPSRAMDLASTYLRWLTAQKIAVVDGDVVHKPGRRAGSQLTGEENRLSEQLLSLIEAGGLTPPASSQLNRDLGTKSQILEGVEKFLLTSGKLAKLPGGLVVATKVVDRIRQELVESDWQRFSVPDFKDRYELSRKWAIPWLEHLDSIGATRRLGNERQIIRRT